MFSNNQKLASNLFSQQQNTSTGTFFQPQNSSFTSGMNNQTSSGFNPQNLGFTGSTTPIQSTPSFFKNEQHLQQQPTTNIFSSYKPTTASNTFPSMNTNSFNVPNTQTMFGGSNMNSNLINNQTNNLNLGQTTNKKEIDKYEIIQIIDNYIYAISILSPTNHFKLMVYNRIDPKRQNYLRSEQEYKQKQRSIDGKEEIVVDHNLWNTALQKNPNPTLYHPFQLNCPKNLVTRALITQSMQRYAFEYIIDYQKKINNSRYIYDVDIQNTLSICKKKLMIVKKSQIAVISKLEKLAIFTKRAEKEYNLESNLIQKFNVIKSYLVENDNIVQNFEDISSKTCFINQFTKKDSETSKLDKMKFQKNLIYFKELKNVFDTTYETLNNDFGVLSFIKNELENSKKYRTSNY